MAVKILTCSLCLAYVALAQSGLVIANNSPVPGATVRAIRGDRIVSTITDESGAYAFKTLTPGVWLIEANMFGFNPIHRELLVSDKTERLDLVLHLRAEGQPNEMSTSDQSVNAVPSHPAFDPTLASHEQSSDQNAVISTRVDPDYPLATASSSEPNHSVAAPVDGIPPVRASTVPSLPVPSPMRWTYFYDPVTSILNAQPFALNGQSHKQPAYVQHRFGGSVDGTVRLPGRFHSDRTTFSVSYGGNISLNGVTLLSTVPSIRQRRGDFSGTGVALFDPSNGSPLPNDIIPQSRIDPSAKALGEFIPLPNQSGIIQNYLTLLTTPNTGHALATQVAHIFPRGDRVSIIMNGQLNQGSSATPYGFIDKSSSEGGNVGIRWQHDIGHDIKSIFAFDSNRTSVSVVPYFSNGQNVAAQSGIQGTSRQPAEYGPPNLQFTNFTALTDANPLEKTTNTSTFSSRISLNLTSHTWTVGGSLSSGYDNTTTSLDPRGTFVFTGIATAAIAPDGVPITGTGYDFADFLLGRPQSASVSYRNSNVDLRSDALSWFLQDDYRVSRGLTLNLGVRYEYSPPGEEEKGRIANLAIDGYFESTRLVTPETPGIPKGLIFPDRNNWAPRLGLAWAPSADHMTVRLGYGWDYNSGAYSQFLSRMAQQPPFASSSFVRAAIGDSLTLENALLTAPQPQNALDTLAVNMWFRAPYAQTWNAGIQTTIPGGLLAELMYSGTKGTRLPIQLLPNQGSIQAASTLQTSNQTSGFVYETSDGNSISHSGQLRVSRPFRAGISATVIYRYGKTIDDSSGLPNVGGGVVQDFRNFRAERAVSDFDRKQTMHLELLWAPTLEVFRNTRNWVTTVINGWTIASNILSQDGTPRTALVMGKEPAQAVGTGIVGSGRASATGLPVGSASGYFSSAAFVLPASGGYGNAGRNTIPGPSWLVINLSVQRVLFAVGNKRLQLRIDVHNVTNHVNITGFDTIIDSLTYGTATAASDMRTINPNLRLTF
ncbi:MAG TPA: TonB-dependent receptor [Bryobacteraceae bacterium]|nr:TonB-dependent receptor [Bryobacteraceae bacterium]